MISYKGRVFQIIPDNGRLSYTRAKVMLQEHRDRSVHVLYQDKELSIVKLPQKPKYLDKPKKIHFKDFLNHSIQSKISVTG
jgi:hypothetical protein